MSSSAFTPTTTQVTTEVPVNVPVVTAWQSYTPTFTGFGTVTSVEMYWRRVGSTLEVKGNFTAGTNTATEARMTLPSGLTTDSFPSIVIAGPAIDAVSSTTYFGSYVLAEPNSTYFTFGMQFSSINALTKTNANNFASSSKLTLMASVQISQWAGSGTTTLADRALEEYAWNSSTTATTDTTSFGNGPDGVNIRAFAPSGNTNIEKRVRFQNPVQSTDRISLEFNTGNGWALASDVSGGQVTNDAGNVSYGQVIRPVSGSTTDFSVFFNSMSTGQTPWSGLTSWKWRVRKVSSGAQVGYPISTKNIVGATDGVAPVTGMIGETVSITPTLKTASTSWTSAASSSITLQAGLWLLSGVTTNFVTSGTYVAAYLSQTLTTSGTGTPSGTTTGIDHLSSACGPGAGSVQISNRFVNVPQGSTQTWYMGVRSDGTAANAWSIYLQATRIA